MGTENQYLKWPTTTAPETPDRTAKRPDTINPHTRESQIEQNRVTQAAEEALRFDETVQRLPEDKRLIALLGCRNDLEIRKLPQPYRVVTISIPKQHVGNLKATMEDLGLPCNSDFIGNSDDQYPTLTYVIPDRSNVDHILHRALQREIPAKIAVAKDATLVLRAQGSPIISIHSYLDDETSKTASEDDSPQALSVAETGNTEEIPLPIGDRSVASRKLEISKKGETRDRGEEIEQPITEFNTLRATFDSVKHANESQFKRPRKGSCTYLLVDQNILRAQSTSDRQVVKLIRELELFLKSPDFHVTSHNGYITIVATAERAGSSLKGIASRIIKASPNSTISIGKGAIQHHGAKEFSIQGFPMTDERADMTALGKGIYIDPALTTGRDASLEDIDTRETNNPKWLELLKYRPKVRLKVGGPDKLIGYDEELAQLTEGTTDEKTQLIILRGNAGMGKSRLLEEALTDLPSRIICSLDPSGKNIPGFGLITVAEQIYTQFREAARNADESGEGSETGYRLLGHPDAKGLADLDIMSQKEKIRLAQRNPRYIEQECFRALCLLNTGKTTLALDDIHHADRFSLTYLTSLAARYMASTKGKVIMSMRQEEMHDPQAITNLTATIDQKAHPIKKITIEGLDFQNSETTREFVFYSLPKELRQTEDGRDRVLGPWHEELGRIAGKSPFVMKSLMDAILEDPTTNLIIRDDVILLNPDILDRIKSIRNIRDLENYYRERISRLSQGSKKVLQCLALMGGHVTTNQIIAVLKRFRIKDRDKIEALTTPLINGGYLVKEGEIWNLQHETMNAIVIDSFENENQKLKFAQELFKAFKTDSSVHMDVKFSLSHNIASSASAPADDDEFWTEYLSLVESAFEDARIRNANSKKYSIAQTVLNQQGGAQAVLRAVETLKQGERVNESLQKLTIQTLFAKAESAMYIGKFKEVADVVETLEQIHTKSPGIIDIQRAHLLIFDRAYLQNDKKEMREIYEQKLNKGANLRPEEKVIVEIKLFYKERRIKEVREAFAKHFPELNLLNDAHRRQHNGMPHPAWAEADRIIHGRIPFEVTRAKMKKNPEGRMIDEDVLMQPGAVTSEHMKELNGTTKHLIRIQESRQKNPLLFNGYSELSLMEQQAVIDAFHGKFDEAIETLNETWRQSGQMGIHREAARTAKLKGDILVLKGTCIVTQTPSERTPGKTEERKVIAREHIREALKTYSEQGMISLAQVDENDFYQKALRIQRIRATGILCESYEDRILWAGDFQLLEKETARNELEKWIKSAIEDWMYLNRKLNIMDPAHNEEVGEYSYYTTTYMGHVISMAQTLEMYIPEDATSIKKAPLLSEKSRDAVRSFATNIFDNEIGEVKRKQEGIDKLDQCIPLAT